MLTDEVDNGLPRAAGGPRNDRRLERSVFVIPRRRAQTADVGIRNPRDITDCRGQFENRPRNDTSSGPSGHLLLEGEGL